MHLGWIWTDNLRPLVFEIALLAGYEFDDPDWIAVEHGMGGTDSEAGPWFEYQVGCVLVTAAFEPGANEMVSAKVDGATEAEAEKIRWLGNLMRTSATHHQRRAHDHAHPSADAAGRASTPGNYGAYCPGP